MSIKAWGKFLKRDLAHIFGFILGTKTLETHCIKNSTRIPKMMRKISIKKKNKRMICTMERDLNMFPRIGPKWIPYNIPSFLLPNCKKISTKREGKRLKEFLIILPRRGKTMLSSNLMKIHDFILQICILFKLG